MPTPHSGPMTPLTDRAHQGRSWTSLVEAVTAMLDEGADPGILNVTDVVQRAGISRPTFYKYFRDVPALVRAAALHRLQVTFDRVPPAALGQTWTVFARGTFLTLLTDLATHRSFYLSALAVSPAGVAGDVVDYLAHRLLTSSPLGPVIHRRPGPDTAQQRAEFLAAGSVWLVQRWLATSDDALGEVEDMVGRLSALLLAGSGATEQEIAAVRTAAPQASAGPEEIA